MKGEGWLYFCTAVMLLGVSLFTFEQGQPWGEEVAHSIGLSWILLGAIHLLAMRIRED